MPVIFDCDGVLVDSEVLVSEIEVELLSTWGWDITPEELRAQFQGKTFGEIARLLRSRLGERLPGDWMYHWAMGIANGFRKHLKEVPGVRAVVERVLRCGLPTCVASQSMRPRVELSLGVCDLDRYFPDRVFTAELVERPKPAPDLFLLAARSLGVAPETCRVVEDSASGVRAARAAGMHVFGYAARTDPRLLAEAGATVFDDMKELPELLQL